jgi:hypothetical protein
VVGGGGAHTDYYSNGGFTMQLSLRLLSRVLGMAATLALLAIPVTAAVAPSLASANSTPRTALIDQESITTNDGIEKEGTPISLEQWAAENAGYTVTVRSGAEWEAMTAEEFAQYQVLIVGDPLCGSTALSAVESAKTWTPVVMGKGPNSLLGNRVVVGTDPEFHYLNGEGGAQPTEPGNPESAGAEHLVQDGITYAGGVSGATGVYFDTSCTDIEEPVPAFTTLNGAPAVTPPQQEVEGPDGRDKTDVLDHLTTVSTPEPWTEDSSPPCGGSVAQVASNPVFDSGPTQLLDSNIEGWSCSVHVTFPQFPADWHALAVATDAATHPTCGTDPETGEPACGEAYVLLAGEGIVAVSPYLSLSPLEGEAEAGSTHTHAVTATVTEERVNIEGRSARPSAIIPAPAVDVSFVLTGQNTGVVGTCTTPEGAADPSCETNANGQVVFTYADANGAGKDTINASDHLGETTEQATATMVWTPAAEPAKQTTTTTTTTTTSTPTPTTTATVVSTNVGKSGVLAFGAARLASSNAKACIASSGYLASVSGKLIASVTFTLDGHKIKTLTHPSGGRFALRIAVKAGGLHHLSIHVSFTSASATKALTINKTLARCAAVHRHISTPRFTG